MDSSNKVMRCLGTLAASALISSAAMGYTIHNGAIDVGALDFFVTEDRLPNSGKSTETNWVNSLVEPDTEFNIKTDNVEYFRVDGESSIYAFNLKSAPEYFLIKNAQNTALFINNDNYDWGVFDLSLFELNKWNLGASSGNGGNGDKNKLKFSHATEFGATLTAVPEPGGIALLGLGLLGMAAVRRICGARRRA